MKGEGFEETRQLLPQLADGCLIGAHRWPGNVKSWVVQNSFWKELGPAGDIFLLQRNLYLQNKMGIFKLLCLLQEKKKVVFCTTKYLCSPDVSWRPPYPIRAM